MGSSQLLLLLLAFLQERLPCALAQAPGDNDAICRTGMNRNSHIFPEEWNVLVDSYDYRNLFDDSSLAVPAVWLRRSFDGDTGNPPLDNWDHSSGGICTQTIRSCTFLSSTSNQNNWLFTQHIRYGDVLQIFFNITYSFRGCTDLSCSPFVTLYRFDSDAEVSDEERTNRDNYQPLYGTEATSRLQTSDPTQNFVRETLNFTRTAGSQGFYFAFQDTGTCTDIFRVIMYYTVVRGRTETFLRCPDVPLPVIGVQALSSLDCSCVGNSSGVGSLARLCDQEGVCNEDQRCACDPGLGYNDTLDMCIVCPVETYKAGVSNDACLPCPMLSEARDPGSAMCECVPPNTRAGGDGPEADCRDRRLSTSAAVAITFFVTLLVVGVFAFLAGGLVAYLCRGRIEKTL